MMLLIPFSIILTFDTIFKYSKVFTDAIYYYRRRKTCPEILLSKNQIRERIFHEWGISAQQARARHIESSQIIVTRFKIWLHQCKEVLLGRDGRLGRGERGGHPLHLHHRVPAHLAGVLLRHVRQQSVLRGDGA